jgi:uroporphyrinogen-III synthase
VTSANALAALGDALRHLPLYAVGDATAARAREAGFAEVTSAGGNAEALAQLLRGCLSPSQGALLLPMARGEGLSLARDLRQAGFAVLRRAVYAAVPHKSLPAAAGTALSRGEACAALFFSPATARSFTKLLLAALPAECVMAVDALALSPAVAAPLASLPWRRIRVAARPDQDALLTLLADADR